MFEGNLMFCKNLGPTHLKGAPTAGRTVALAFTACETQRCAAHIVSTGLPMVCWWRNTKALHLVKQGGPLQTKSGSRSSWSSELPIGALASSENFFTHLVFKGGV